MSKTDLKSLDSAQMQEFFKRLGQPAYRAGQLLEWIYERRATTIEEITVFSKSLRASLNEAAYISNLQVAQTQHSEDGTVKFALELPDGNAIESVLIPGNRRLTLCISSQAGCAMGCAFCLTGVGGLKRNLKAHEIAGQVVEALRFISPRKITNIVLMGMGEPLNNFDEVSKALYLLEGQLGFASRRITLSTCGLVERMLQLPSCAPPVNLAVSLNATTDEVRDTIMPVNKRYPIAELMAACQRYPLQKRRRITFEYVLLGGVNDTQADARRLVKLLSHVKCKVNLIPFNGFIGSKFRPPEVGRVLAFQGILEKAGIVSLIRKSMGADILAACGQLAGAAKPHFK